MENSNKGLELNQSSLESAIGCTSEVPMGEEPYEVHDRVGVSLEGWDCCPTESIIASLHCVQVDLKSAHTTPKETNLRVQFF